MLEIVNNQKKWLSLTKKRKWKKIVKRNIVNIKGDTTVYEISDSDFHFLLSKNNEVAFINISQKWNDIGKGVGIGDRLGSDENFSEAQMNIGTQVEQRFICFPLGFLKEIVGIIDKQIEKSISENTTEDNKWAWQGLIGLLEQQKTNLLKNIFNYPMLKGLFIDYDLKDFALKWEETITDFVYRTDNVEKQKYFESLKQELIAAFQTSNDFILLHQSQPLTIFEEFKQIIPSQDNQQIFFSHYNNLIEYYNGLKDKVAAYKQELQQALNAE